MEKKYVKYVWIVMRKKNNELLMQFVFANKADANKCAARLHEMYPDEIIDSELYIVREVYK